MDERGLWRAFTLCTTVRLFSSARSTRVELGAAVAVENQTTVGRWPRFTAAASEVGFAAVHALPMRLRSDVIGALNMFGTEAGALDQEKLRIGQARGLLAERRQIDVDQAFTLLRSTARQRNQRLSDLAQALLDGTERLQA